MQYLIFLASDFPPHIIRNVLITIVEKCKGFWWESLRERDHWGDPDVVGMIILRGIFRKWKGVVETGWSGLRIGSGGGHL
jgi:hypothetical protein